MLSQNQENKYLHMVYRNITCLGILLHSFYSLMFAILQYPVPLYYNIIDIFFYMGLLLLVTQHGKYAWAVSLIHIETILFCVVHVLLFGWNPCFYIYLFAMASLVYFCPYRSIFTPYLFSFLHIIAFFVLYLISRELQAPIIVNDSLIALFFVCNSSSAFIIILYVAYVSKASASVGRQELLKKNKDLQHLANYDQMTGLYNRTCLRNRFDQLHGIENVLAIGDIDDFKAVNDTYGHICGDVILKELAEQMRAKLDPNIFLCRWGGEEFVFIFSNCSKEDVKQQLDNFCQWIAQYNFQYEGLDLHITMTFGLSLGDRDQSLDKWIEEADLLLYKGKHSGKNIVICE